jgi:tetratricopeptide (TPR) repeat protein
LKYSAKTYEVRHEVLGLNHPDTAASLMSLGNAYLQLGKFEAAVDCQQRSLAISEELFGKRSVWRAMGLRNLGLAHHGTKHFSTALKCFEEALEIRKELFGDVHPETIALVVDCAFTLCRVNRIHPGHKLMEEWGPKLPKDHLLYQWFTEKRRVLQRQFPRPGFRQLRGR